MTSIGALFYWPSRFPCIKRRAAWGCASLRLDGVGPDPLSISTLASFSAGRLYMLTKLTDAPSLLEFGLTPDAAERAARQPLIGARQREQHRYKSGITH